MAQLLILLASYQGAAFLDQQLHSIRCQTYRDWRLLVHNDGPDAAAADLVARHATQDSRIEWLAPTSKQRLGVCNNFGFLLTYAQQHGCRYFALADQDDVWFEDKLECQMMMLQQAEQRLGSSVPLLVHSDLRLVDAQLQPLAVSFMQQRGLNPQPNLATLLAQNSVTGCTCIGNQALLRLALPLPECIAMHDWWLALCAQAGGELLYLAKPTVYYRQHQKNTVGAGLIPTHLGSIICRTQQAFRASFAQAAALQARLTADKPAMSILQQYAALPQSSYLQRGSQFRRLAIKRAGLMADWFYRLQLLLL